MVRIEGQSEPASRPMSKRSRARKTERLYRRQRRCQHPGCTREGMPCFIELWSEKPDEFFCHAHAFQYGYCRGCGRFWSGVESFDFGPDRGWCEHCRDQLRADMGEDIWEDDFDYGYADAD